MDYMMLKEASEKWKRVRRGGLYIRPGAAAVD